VVKSRLQKQKYRRRWARFKVNTDKINAKIHQGIDRMSRLQTLSLGGCSFLSRRGDARLLLNPKVRVSLKIAGQEIIVEGQVHYCQFIPHLGLDKNLLGIEFKWPTEQMQKDFGLLIGKAVNEGCLEQLSNIEV